MSHGLSLLRRLFLYTFLLPALFVCDVRAQTPGPARGLTHADTALFNGDTVIFHGTPATAALPREFARYVAGMRALPGIARAVKPSIIHTYLAADERSFAALTGGAAPHWGAGVAEPDSGIIVVPAYSSERVAVENMGPVIRHEIAHVELQRALGSLRIPRWFTEGYAVWSAGQLDPDADWYLRLAFVTERAPPLDSLELGWPSQENDARVAYLLSASAVSYLHSLGDDAAFAAFFDSWRANASFEQALRSVYLISSTQFETSWAKYVRKHYGWLLFAAQGVVIWAFLAVFVVILIFVRRRRDRRRLADLQKQEPPDAPAYWLDSYVEPDDVEAADDEPAEGPTPGNGHPPG